MGIVVECKELAQAFHLRYQTLPYHIINSAVDHLVQALSPGGQAYDEGVKAWRGFALNPGRGTVGRLVDLQGPDDTAEISGVHSAGRDRIDALQLTVECLNSFCRCPLLHPASEFGVGRDLRDVPALKDCPYVETAATDEYWQLASLHNVLDGSASQRLIESKAEILIGIKDIDKMVRCGSALLRSGLGRADIHVPIDLAAVGIDELGIESPCQKKAQLALAYAGRPDDGMNEFHARLASADCCTILRKSAAFRLAPPTRAPSISG